MSDKNLLRLYGVWLKLNEWNGYKPFLKMNVCEKSNLIIWTEWK